MSRMFSSIVLPPTSSEQVVREAGSSSLYNRYISSWWKYLRGYHSRETELWAKSGTLSSIPTTSEITPSPASPLGHHGCERWGLDLSPAFFMRNCDYRWEWCPGVQDYMDLEPGHYFDLRSWRKFTVPCSAFTALALEESSVSLKARLHWLSDLGDYLCIQWILRSSICGVGRRKR